MVKVILDTNFVLSCIRERIDFYSFIRETFGDCNIVVGKELFDELENIYADKKNKKSDRDSSKIAIQLIKTIPHEVVMFNTKNVDKGILNYVKSSEDIIYVATLDRVLRKNIKKHRPFSKFISLRKSKKSPELTPA
jgi:rRNA-processing protein FCF1